MTNCALRLSAIPKTAFKKMHGARGVSQLVSVPPYHSFDIGNDLQPFMDVCRSHDGLARAFGMVEALSDEGKGRTSGFARVLYIIGVDGEPGICKIGISSNPFRRLSDLQGAHYRPLWLHSVLFFPTRKAMTVEQHFLSNSAERMCGEWLAVEPDDLLSRVLSHSRDEKIPVIDGGNWFKDITARTYAIARATKFLRAA